MTAKTAAGEPAVYVFGTPVSGEGYLIVSAGNSQSVVASGNFVAGESGKEYMTAFFSGSRQSSDPVRFKIATPSAISDIEIH